MSCTGSGALGGFDVGFSNITQGSTPRKMIAVNGSGVGKHDLSFKVA